MTMYIINLIYAKKNTCFFGLWRDIFFSFAVHQEAVTQRHTVRTHSQEKSRAFSHSSAFTTSCKDL